MKFDDWLKTYFCGIELSPEQIDQFEDAFDAGRAEALGQIYDRLDRDMFGSWAEFRETYPLAGDYIFGDGK